MEWKEEREKIKTENDCYYSFWNKLRVLSRFRSSVWPCVRYAFKNELDIFPCSPSFLCADIFYSTTNGCFSFFPNVVTSFMQLIHFSLYYLLLNFGLITMFIAFARKMKTQNSLRPGCLCVCWCCFCVNFIENLYRFIKSHSFFLLHRFSAQ